MDDVSFCSYYTCNPILLLEISYIFRCKVTSAGAGIYPTGEKWWKSKYTYNYRTEQYEDEDGNWAEWTEVYDWMNNSGQFMSSYEASVFFSGLGYGAPADGYAMGYVYYLPGQNAIVGRVNDGHNVTVRTINISGGNGYVFQGGPSDDWMGRAGNISNGIGFVAGGLEMSTSRALSRTLAYYTPSVSTIKPPQTMFKVPGGSVYISTKVVSAANSLFKFAGNGAEVITTTLAYVDIYQGKDNVLTYTDAAVGTTALANSLAGYLGYVKVPVIGQIAALYGWGRFWLDMGYNYGPSHWYGTDDTKWFK